VWAAFEANFTTEEETTKRQKDPKKLAASARRFDGGERGRGARVGGGREKKVTVRFPGLSVSRRKKKKE
jgi:hypothetical protein